MEKAVEFHRPQFRHLRAKSSTFSSVGSQPEDSVQEFKCYLSSSATWIPHSLRWQWMLLSLFTCLSLCIATFALTIYSTHCHGLGSNNGSKALLFGWRFMPTLVAVLYTQLTSILVEDVKRTEPFARMNGSVPSGVVADHSVLQTSAAWWTAFRDGFSRKRNNGKRSWALMCSTSINIIAFLLISPLSSSFLTTDTLSISEPKLFSRMVPVKDKQISLNPGRETYLRTTSNFLANISTTHWITDDYVVLPFQPATTESILVEQVLHDPDSWQADAMVFEARLDCTNMSLVSRSDTRQISAEPRYNCSGASQTWPTSCDNPINVTGAYIPSITVRLASADGCEYELEVPWDTLYANPWESGYVSWTHMSGLDDLLNNWVPTGVPWIVGNTTLHSMDAVDFSRLNISEQCGNREILLLTTPWTVGRPFGGWNTLNMTAASHVEIVCFICSQSLKMATTPVKISRDSGDIQATVSKADFMRQSAPIPSELINFPDLQNLGLHQNWSTIVGGVQDRPEGQTLRTYGIASVLSTYFSNSFSDMLGSSELLAQAARLRNRFIYELIFSSVTAPNAFQMEDHWGTRAVIEERVVVATGVGIVLTIVFALSFVLHLLLLHNTRLSRRPIGLCVDPSTTIGLAALLETENPNLVRTQMQELWDYSKDSMARVLRKHSYQLDAGKMRASERIVNEEADMLRNSQTLEAQTTYITPTSTESDSLNASATARWEPRLLHIATLSTFLILLVCMLTVLLMIYESAQSHGLYQSAFTYEIETPAFGSYWSAFSPISVASAATAILVGMWWAATDEVFRSLQPFMSMSQRPQDVTKGIGLSYVSTYWFWASFKAATKGNLGLACVTLGTTASQILIVSISALFQIQTGVVSAQTQMHRACELRQVPIISSTWDQSWNLGLDIDQLAIQKAYVNDTTSWIYGATNQMAMDSSPRPWTQDEWSFVPVDQSQSLGTSFGQLFKATDNARQTANINMTLTVTAVRARLECESIDEASQMSSWVSVHNLSIPSPSLKAANDSLTVWQLKDELFDNTTYQTTMFAANTFANCCSNVSSDTHRSALGHWTTVTSSLYPHAGAQWPVPFVSKWILGNAQPFYELADLPRYNDDRMMGDIGRLLANDAIFFDEKPMFQASLCRPSIESAQARVTVDIKSEKVQSYRILSEPELLVSPWLDSSVHHTENTAQECENLLFCQEGRGIVYPNVTNSYGVLFMNALLGASFYASPPFTSDQLTFAPLDDAFTIQDRNIGLNLDLMSYAMYNLVDRDPYALLNATVLSQTTQRVFQTYFQHFVSEGWAYQDIDETLPKDLPPPIDHDRNIIAQNEFPKLHTNRTVVVTVEKSAKVLHISKTATTISAGILAWLIATMVFIIAMHARHRHLMFRNIECIADVLVLVAGSDNLLKLIAGRGPELYNDKSVFTRLGWFRKADGEVRYGIEVAGGENAVEWLDPPKK